MLNRKRTKFVHYFWQRRYFFELCLYNNYTFLQGSFIFAEMLNKPIILGGKLCRILYLKIFFPSSGSYLQFWQKINGQTSQFARKLHFLGIRKVLNLGLKAEKPLQNENHTEDWALGSHPRDNGHVTH